MLNPLHVDSDLANEVVSSDSTPKSMRLGQLICQVPADRQKLDLETVFRLT